MCMSYNTTNKKFQSLVNYYGKRKAQSKKFWLKFKMKFQSKTDIRKFWHFSSNSDAEFNAKHINIKTDTQQKFICSTYWNVTWNNLNGTKNILNAYRKNAKKCFLHAKSPLNHFKLSVFLGCFLIEKIKN